MKEPLILRSLGCIFTNEEEQERMPGAIPIEGGAHEVATLCVGKINVRGDAVVTPKLSRRVWRDELDRCLTLLLLAAVLCRCRRL